MVQIMENIKLDIFLRCFTLYIIFQSATSFKLYNDPPLWFLSNPTLVP